MPYFPPVSGTFSFLRINMDEKPLSPSDVVEHIFTQRSQNVLVSNINSKLKTPGVTLSKKLIVRIDESEVTKGTQIHLPWDIIIEKIRLLYQDWYVTYEEYPTTGPRNEVYTGHRYVFTSRESVL
jgi:hypothetical protein